MEARAASIAGRLEAPGSPAYHRESVSGNQGDRAGKTQPDSQTDTPGMTLDEAASELSLKFKFNVEVENDKIAGHPVVRIMSPDGRTVLHKMPPEAAVQLALRARSGALRNLLDFMV